MRRLRHDGVLVVGAGLAGLTAALSAAPANVLVRTGAPLNQGCSSAWAQGGVAVAMAADDAPALHAADTVAAGAGLVDPAMARLLSEEGPTAVRRLAAIGAPFDRTVDGGFAQSLEAAHSRARVARVKGDQAGREIGRGIVRYDAADAARICGLKTDAIESVLGYSEGPMIHADDLALAAGAVG